MKFTNFFWKSAKIYVFFGKNFKKISKFSKKVYEISWFGPDVILSNKTPMYTHQILKFLEKKSRKIDEGVVVEFSKLAQTSNPCQDVTRPLSVRDLGVPTSGRNLGALPPPSGPKKCQNIKCLRAKIFFRHLRRRKISLSTHTFTFYCIFKW